MDIKVVVGDNIRFIREKKNLTQEDLSAMTGMSKTFIGDIERAMKAPTIVSIAKIAKALKIEAHLLLKADGYKELK